MTSTVARQVARGGGGPPQPPFARNKPVDYQVCVCLRLRDALPLSRALSLFALSNLSCSGSEGCCNVVSMYTRLRGNQADDI